MSDEWKELLSCALECKRCGGMLESDAKRILSVYDHQPICMSCKKEEESRPDYDDVAQRMIGQCMMETEQMYSDPAGYCYFHFYPFTC
ncbi:MAG TPA: hypothetical protein VKO20_08535 [Desulfosalsimonadaceae bacterium]|nr:hypothetical protein [Desulfosalsimonadaceae bacterium]